MDRSFYDVADKAMDDLLATYRGTLYDVVARQYDKIIEARSLGYSLNAIAKVLADAGVPISADVLRIYLKRIAATGRKPKTRAPSTESLNILPSTGAKSSPVTVPTSPRAEPSAPSSTKRAGSYLGDRPVTPRQTTLQARKPAMDYIDLPSARAGLIETLRIIAEKRQTQQCPRPPSTSGSSVGQVTVHRRGTYKLPPGEVMPPIPSDWIPVQKRVNGQMLTLYRPPNRPALYSLLPGVNADAPYGRDEHGVAYNMLGAPTWSMIGSGFIGEDI